MICYPNTPLDEEHQLVSLQCGKFKKALNEVCLPARQACRDKGSGCKTIRYACSNCSTSEYLHWTSWDPNDYTQKFEQNKYNAREKCLQQFVDLSKSQLGGIEKVRLSNSEVYGAFVESGDMDYKARLELDALLTQTALKVPVLINAGDTSLYNCCLAVKQTLASTICPSQPAFKNALLSQPESKYPNLTLPSAKNAYGHYVLSGSDSKLVYARIFGAGQNVAESRPVEANDLVLRWVFKGKLD